MNRDLKKLALAVGVGFAMGLILWLFVNEGSPAYRYLRDQPEAGFAVLILDFPALLLARLFFKQAGTALYILCFVQWFSVGMLAASRIWCPDEGPSRVRADDQGTRQ